MDSTRACEPFHGIRIVSPAPWEGEPYAIASCLHGTREAHGVTAIQRLSAAYAEHRKACKRQAADEAPTGAVATRIRPVRAVTGGVAA